MLKPTPTGLIILDGAGLAPQGPSNSVTREFMPFLFNLMDNSPATRLKACGEAVGLFPGQTGNSEVGHLTIGMGRITQSAIRRIDEAFHNGTWKIHKIWKGLDRAKPLHIVGLLSDAGVHGHFNTIVQAAALAHTKHFSEVFVHVVLDGMDSAAGSAPALLKDLTAQLEKKAPSSRLGLVMGRRWFMDRSGNDELTNQFVMAILNGSDQPHKTFSAASLKAHLKTECEETFPPHVFDHGRLVKKGETILLTAHRADRAKQAVSKLSEIGRCITMVTICDDVMEDSVFFPTPVVEGGLARHLARAGVFPVRIAENCKFPHVSYFFNGFSQSFGETQHCIADIPGGPGENPHMRIMESVQLARSVMRDPLETSFVMNIPNLDQVGHVGSLKLAQQAAATVDKALEEIVETAKEEGWSLLITADHGNAEQMMDQQGRPFGSHTCNDVPFIVSSVNGRSTRPMRRNMGLENIAATFCDTLGVDTRGGGMAASVFQNGAKG